MHYRCSLVCMENEFPVEDFQLPNPLGEVEEFPLEQVSMNEPELSMGPSDIYSMEDYLYSQNSEDEPQQEVDFHENLAEYLSESELHSLAGELIDLVQKDKESRSKWDTTNKAVLDKIGFDLKSVNETSDGLLELLNVYDSTLATALVTFCSVITPELLPSGGPADYKILGVPTLEDEQEGENIKDFLNHYLMDVDKPFYSDFEKLIISTAFFGSGFKVVQRDDISGSPISRFVKASDMIINYECTSLIDSDRITQVTYFTKKEIMMRQLNGTFISMPLKNINSDDEDDSSYTIESTIKSMDGVTSNEDSDNSLYKFYVMQCNLIIEQDKFEVPKKKFEKEVNYEDIPKPYLITICLDSRTIVSIRRDWEQDSTEFKRKKRIVHYYYMPGFGLYGLGLSSLIGSNCLTSTSILKQLLTSAIFNNYPAGFLASNTKIQDNEKRLEPGEFRRLESGQLPIQSVVMGLPFKGADPLLNELRMDINRRSEALAATSQMPIENINGHLSQVVLFALLESLNTVQSRVAKGFHKSFGEELELIYNIFKENELGEYNFSVPGKEVIVSKDNFRDNFKIIPVSDPNIMTSYQRILRNDAILKTAQAFPELHNMRNIITMLYESLGVRNIDKIMMPEEQSPNALDPITENTYMIQGKPVKAALWQNHDAHMVTHNMISAEQYPNSAAAVQAHTQEHLAMKYLVEMQAKIGMEMPDEQQLMNPEVQNQIAVMAAEVAQQEQAQQQDNQPQPLDPSQVMMADIEQRREKAEMDLQIEQLKLEIEKMKLETKTFEAQLRFETEKNKLEAQKDIQEEKNELALLINEMKTTKGEINEY